MVFSDLFCTRTCVAEYLGKTSSAYVCSVTAANRLTQEPHRELLRDAWLRFSCESALLPSMLLFTGAMAHQDDITPPM